MDLNLLIKLVHRSVDIENKQQRFGAWYVNTAFED